MTQTESNGFCLGIPNPSKYDPENLKELRRNLHSLAERVNRPDGQVYVRVKDACESIGEVTTNDDFEVRVDVKDDEGNLDQTIFRFSTIDRAKAFKPYGDNGWIATEDYSWLSCLSHIIDCLKKNGVLSHANTTYINCYFNN